MDLPNQIPDEKWFRENQPKLDSILGISPEVRRFWDDRAQDASNDEVLDIALPVESQVENSIPPLESPVIEVAEKQTPEFGPQILTWEEFVNQPVEHQPWVIEGVLRPGWLAVLGGHGKQGKTTLAVHLLNALSQGERFIYNTLAVPTIHFNFEMAADDLRELIKTVSAQSFLRTNAKVINQLPVPLNLKWLESFLETEELPGVCVIDSFRAAFMLSGDSENQAGAVGGILRRLQTIARKTQWTIIVIHHFRKSGTGEALDLAGSGEWLSAPDVIYTWSCPKPTEPGELKITGRVPPLEPLSIRLTRENLEFLGTVSENEAESERQLILEQLTENWIKGSQLAKDLEIPEGSVRRRLAELLESGLTERTGSGKKGDAFLWRRIRKSQQLTKPTNPEDESIAVAEKIFGAKAIEISPLEENQ